MADHLATLHITKLAAAQRQLKAAIRMFFAGEDELAIHTVASAAYGILSHLKKDRGRDEVADIYLTTVFYAVRDYQRGTLPSYLADDPEMMKWIVELAEQLPIKKDSKLTDICASASPDVVAKYWRERNRVSNFLKHADRDPKAHIALDEIDNFKLLAQSVGSYTDIGGSGLGNEGLVFWLYFSVYNRMTEGLPKEFEKIGRDLESLDESSRLEFCREWLRELNAK